MGKILFSIFMVLVLCPLAYGSVYLVVDKSSQEIVSISSQDDAVVEAGQEKIVLSGSRQDIALDQPIQYYKYSNGRFILNVKKMSDEDKAKEAFDSKKSEEELIKNKALKIACDALVAEGVVLNIIKCSDYEK